MNNINKYNSRQMVVLLILTMIIKF